MKTYLTAHLILACLITILTVSGLIPKNVYAEDDGRVKRRFIIEVRNPKTEEKLQCPMPLESPIVATLRPDALDEEHPGIWQVEGMTKFYRNKLGNVDSSAHHIWQSGIPHGQRRSSFPIDIIDPGPDQSYHAYLMITREQKSGGLKDIPVLYFASIYDEKMKCTLELPIREREPGSRDQKRELLIFVRPL